MIISGGGRRDDCDGRAFALIAFLTRMDSSRMHSARFLTVSQYALHRGIISACTVQGRVSQHALGRGRVYPHMHWAGGCLPRGVCVW